MLRDWTGRNGINGRGDDLTLDITDNTITGTPQSRASSVIGLLVEAWKRIQSPGVYSRW